jgi:DNA-binding XRE family transcriptional regulator
MENKTLKKYLDDSKMGRLAFAKKVGISRNHLYCITRKKANPSPIVAAKIEQLTGGVVSLYELLGIAKN